MIVAVLPLWISHLLQWKRLAHKKDALVHLVHLRTSVEANTASVEPHLYTVMC